MFVSSINKVQKRETKKEIFAELLRSFLSFLFIIVCRSFFEAHKLPYSFMLCLKCQDTDRELKLNEIAAWTTGLPGSTEEEKPENTKWSTQISWNQVNMLRMLGDIFDGFVGEFLRQP